MGANQSSGADSASAGGGEVKTSYYELLGLERTATDDEYDARHPPDSTHLTLLQN